MILNYGLLFLLLGASLVIASGLCGLKRSAGKLAAAAFFAVLAFWLGSFVPFPFFDTVLAILAIHVVLSGSTPNSGEPVLKVTLIATVASMLLFTLFVQLMSGGS